MKVILNKKTIDPQEQKYRLLAHHLHITSKESQELIDSGDYLVLTDDEADEKCAEYIKYSLWAFNASFLAGHCEIDESVIKSIQDNEKYEDNNPVFEKLIKDMDHFIQDAVSADGRGHFMTSYDGEEIELKYKDRKGNTKYFYAYRIN